MVIRTSQPSPATVAIELDVRQQTPTFGTVKATIDCNPSRTLTHLLAAHGEHEMFADMIRDLNTGDFFAEVDGVLRGLDGNDNVIADHDTAVARLGRDPFGAFLPTFSAQLQNFVMHLLAPTFGAERFLRVEGAELVMSDAAAPGTEPSGVTVRVRWGQALLPQFEAYFERHHATALAMVRAAAHAALAGLDRVIVTTHPGGPSVERAADAVTVKARVPGDRELAVYAKLPDRIRFEVRKRKGTSRYPAADASTRLLTMLQAARAELLTQNWRDVERLFVEPDLPYFPDFLRFTDLVTGACLAASVSPGDMLRSLLVDGGISSNATNQSVIDLLVRRGVLQRITLRHRAGPPPHRYSLTPDFRTMQERLLAAFAA